VRCHRHNRCEPLSVRAVSELQYDCRMILKTRQTCEKLHSTFRRGTIRWYAIITKDSISSQCSYCQSGLALTSRLSSRFSFGLAKRRTVRLYNTFYGQSLHYNLCMQPSCAGRMQMIGYSSTHTCADIAEHQERKLGNGIFQKPPHSVRTYLFTGKQVRILSGFLSIFTTLVLCSYTYVLRL
jgi:hypothetical protein